MIQNNKRLSTISSKGHLIQFLFQAATQIPKHQLVRVLLYYTTQCGFSVQCMVSQHFL